MAQLTDLLIGSTLPLHPRFGKNPWISLQLVQGEKILDETRAVEGDENGIWEIDSPINLPETDQLLTLAVVVHSHNSKRQLVSATFRIESLFAQLKASPNEYYEFITCDSCASLQVILSFSIKEETSIVLETPSPHPVADVNRYLAHEEIDVNDQESVLEKPNSFSREDLRNAYTNLAYEPNSDDKWGVLSNIGYAYYALYQESQDTNDLDSTISIQREAVNFGCLHPQLAQILEYLSSALETRYAYSGNRADIDEAIQASQNGLDLTQQDARARAALLLRLASNLYSRFKRVGDVADIDMAISTYSEGLALMPEGRPSKVEAYNNFALALFQRFERLGVLQDLNRTIFNLESVVSRTPDGHPDKPSRYNNLGVAFQTRFDRLDNLADLEMAISNRQTALSLTPEGHPDKPSHYNNLGNALEIRFERLGNLTDLEMAISNKQTALSLTPDGHPDKPSRYNNLGIAFQYQFKRLGNLTDLEMAISNMKRAVSRTPDGHSDKPSHYNNLGNALEIRFNRLGNLTDLEMAIFNKQTALSLTPDGHPNKPLYHNSLGIALENRFDHLGNLTDLEMAISNKQTALSLTPDGYRDKPSYHNSLGNALQTRFERLGNLTDLEMTISSKQTALSLTPEGHPDKPSRYSNLGFALETRFDRLGNLTDLEMAISNKQTALSLTPDGHPNKPSHYHNLGNALEIRFERLGNLTDLEMAISNKQTALSLTPEGHPDKPSRYSNLGIALETRFDRLGNLTDLEMAISNKQAALSLTPDGHPAKPSHYNNLGNALGTRFERLGNLTDLDMSISNMQNALRLTPDGHPDKSLCYHNLGISLQSRFGHLGDFTDLNKATSNLENALSLKPDGHPEKVSMTSNLARCYERRFNSSAQRSDLDMALSLYATAAQSPVGYPRTRFYSALGWSHCAKLTNNSPISAYRCAIDQLPRIAWLGIPVSEQHSLLEEIGGAVRDAVAAAVEAEEYNMAVEWMEQGRSIVWQNLLKLRAPVDDLRAVHPELADRLQLISRQLDPPASQELIPQTRQDKRPQEIAKSHTSLAIEWDETIDLIRRLPNFNSFLQPKAFDTLSLAAHEGPVIILNMAKDRCDALALIPSSNGGTSVVSIPLSFSLKQSEKLLHKLTTLLWQVGVRDGETRKPTQQPRKVEIQKGFKSILYTLWVAVVKPVLDGLAYQPQSSDLSRIWWCATGPLSFLPIHAAGDYDTTELGQKVSDYVVSSYTPTVTAILDSSYPIPSDDFKLLTVAQPSALGYSKIPKTMEEVERIVKVATSISVVSFAKEAATVKRVQKEMRESHWVHLACHGKQDASKPIESGLILYDGTLKLSTIIKESLPKADFAFLSACQTAMGEQKVAEESVHLAAGMLLAGYKSVVATMWSIKDDVAPQVTEVVYSRMLKDGKPNRREAAYALHEAVKQLRESGADFTSWVPFIHIGR